VAVKDARNNKAAVKAFHLDLLQVNGSYAWRPRSLRGRRTRSMSAIKFDLKESQEISSVSTMSADTGSKRVGYRSTPLALKMRLQGPEASNPKHKTIALDAFAGSGTTLIAAGANRAGAAMASKSILPTATSTIQRPTRVRGQSRNRCRPQGKLSPT